MNLKEFSKHWIAINVKDTELYGDLIKKDVQELVDVVLNQHHSGASFILTLMYFIKMIEDWGKND